MNYLRLLFLLCSAVILSGPAWGANLVVNPVYPFPTEKEKLIRSYLVNSDHFFQKGDYDGAIAEVRKALAVDPNDRFAQSELTTYLEIKADSKNWLWRFKRWFWIAVSNAIFSIWFYISLLLAALLFGIYYSIRKGQQPKEVSDAKVKSGNEKKSRVALWDSAKRNKIWMLINLSTLIVYLCLSFLSWPNPTNGYVVDVAAWAEMAFPIVLLMLLANVLWILFSLGRRNWPDFLLAILVVFFWIYLHPIVLWFWFDILKAHDVG